MIALSSDKRYLEIRVTEDYIYDIPLFTIMGEADIWQWKYHLRGKSWCTPELLADLERLARASWDCPLYNSQAHV